MRRFVASTVQEVIAAYLVDPDHDHCHHQSKLRFRHQIGPLIDSIVCVSLACLPCSLHHRVTLDGNHRSGAGSHLAYACIENAARTPTVEDDWQPVVCIFVAKEIKQVSVDVERSMSRADKDCGQRAMFPFIKT